MSSSQGFTIGTSPWDDSCKRRRKAAATALNKPSVTGYMPILDRESASSVRDLWNALNAPGNQNGDVDPVLCFQKYALNTSLALNYGVRIGEDLLKEIVHVEREVSNFRSTSNNWQDYVPVMRLWSRGSSGAEEYRIRRDKYMTALLGMLKDNIRNGVDSPCITGNILKDPEANINEGPSLSQQCLTWIRNGG